MLRLSLQTSHNEVIIAWRTPSATSGHTFKITFALTLLLHLGLALIIRLPNPKPGPTHLLPSITAYTTLSSAATASPNPELLELLQGYDFLPSMPSLEYTR